MNLLWEFDLARQKMKWCKRFGVFLPRVKRLVSTRDNLRQRVGDFLGISGDLIAVKKPPVRMPPGKVAILRVIQAWVFNDSVIECTPENYTQGLSNTTFSVDIEKKSDRVENKHLLQVLSEERHPFELKGYGSVRQTGRFSKVDGSEFVFSEFEERLLSYTSEKNFALAWCVTDKVRAFYVDSRLADEHEPWVIEEIEKCVGNLTLVDMLPFEGSTRRGIGERPCGSWTIPKKKLRSSMSESCKTWKVLRSTKDSIPKKKWKVVENKVVDYVKSSSCKAINVILSRSGSEKLSFDVSLRGTTDSVSQTDLKDLFGAASINAGTEKKMAGRQQIVFDLTRSKPLIPPDGVGGVETSWDRTLIELNIPEGARLLSALASDRRRDHFIRLETGDESNADEFVDMHLDASQTALRKRWRRMNTDLTVYVPAISVPATTIPLVEKGTLYCLCANTLEVKGGAVRVEGLTLLPAGRLYFLLCRLSFGLFRKENLDNGSLVAKSLRWVLAESGGTGDVKDWERRIDAAVSFHEGSMELEEKLECFPDKVKELLAVFSGVGGREATVWATLISDPFIGCNLQSLRDNTLAVRKSSTNGTGYEAKGQDAPSKAAPKALDVAVDVEKETLEEAELILAATSHLNIEDNEKNTARRKRNKKRSSKRKGNRRSDDSTTPGGRQ